MVKTKEEIINDLENSIKEFLELHDYNQAETLQKLAWVIEDILKPLTPPPKKTIIVHDLWIESYQDRIKALKFFRKTGMINSDGILTSVQMSLQNAKAAVDSIPFCFDQAEVHENHTSFGSTNPPPPHSVSSRITNELLEEMKNAGLIYAFRPRSVEISTERYPVEVMIGRGLLLGPTAGIRKIMDG